MRAEIARIQRTLKVTTLYVTHDQVEAMTMGDRVAVMRGGELQQVDEPQRLYDAPVNLFVASFVGSPPMNLLEAELDGAGGTLTCRLGETEVELPSSVVASRPALARYAGRRIALGIRPESVQDASLADGGLRVRGRALLVEALGAELLVHVQIAARPLDRPDLVDAPVQAEGAFAGVDDGAATLLGRLDRTSAVRPDDVVELSIDTSGLHFFDLETGDAIPALHVPVEARLTGS
jgi:multiple sugar transport system ATP-binding protein